MKNHHYERAIEYRKMIDEGKSIKEIMHIVKRSKSYVFNTLRVLELHGRLLELLNEGKIPLVKAAKLSLLTHTQQLAWYDKQRTSVTKTTNT